MFVLKVYECVQSNGKVGMLARSISPWDVTVSTTGSIPAIITLAR